MTRTARSLGPNNFRIPFALHTAGRLDPHRKGQFSKSSTASAIARSQRGCPRPSNNRTAPQQPSGTSLMVSLIGLGAGAGSPVT